MVVMSIMIADDKKIFKCGLLFLYFKFSQWYCSMYLGIVLLCIQFADSAGNIAAGTLNSNKYTVFLYCTFRIFLSECIACSNLIISCLHLAKKSLIALGAIAKGFV